MVTGQIIDLSVHRSDDGTTYCPVVKYTDGQEEYVIESSYCSSGYHNAPGDDIDVIYQRATRITRLSTLSAVCTAEP